jgi:pSer/pThr/pTyr-binding forkhead associated (FHA) protein
MEKDTDNISNNRFNPDQPPEENPDEPVYSVDRDLMRSKTTVDVFGAELPPELLSGDAYTTLQPDLIALHLPGLQAPIIIQGEDNIVLGRGEEADLVLTDIEFDADPQALMSVSRKHAAIHRTDAGFFLEDLNSTNGTWLNGRILIPGQPYRLRSADQVRLGEQILYVYLSISAKRAVHTLLLEHRSHPAGEESGPAPTPADLPQKAESYLHALAKIQQILDDAQDYPSEVEVLQVDMHENGQWVEVSIRGASQAIEVTNRKIAQLTEIEGKDLPETGALDPDPQVMAATHMATAREIINAVAPELVGGPFRQMVEELVPHIAAIARSNFKIVSWSG